MRSEHPRSSNLSSNAEDSKLSLPISPTRGSTSSPLRVYSQNMATFLTTSVSVSLSNSPQSHPPRPHLTAPPLLNSTVSLPRLSATSFIKVVTLALSPALTWKLSLVPSNLHHSPLYPNRQNRTSSEFYKIILFHINHLLPFQTHPLIHSLTPMTFPPHGEHSLSLASSFIVCPLAHKLPLGMSPKLITQFHCTLRNGQLPLLAWALTASQLIPPSVSGFLLLLAHMVKFARLALTFSVFTVLVHSQGGLTTIFSHVFYVSSSMNIISGVPDGLVTFRISDVLGWASSPEPAEPSPFKPEPGRALTRAYSGLRLGFRFRKPEPEAQARA